MNDILKAMQTRRSVRRFRSDMLSQETMDEIIQAGLYAASGRGKQCPIIIAVTDQKLRDQLSAMNSKIGGWDSSFDPFYGAPVVLVVLAPRDVPTYLYDGSLVMGNLMLAAHSLGVGSCWIHRAKEEFDSEEGKAILTALGIEGDWEGIGHCVLGYAEEELSLPPERRENRVCYVK